MAPMLPSKPVPELIYAMGLAGGLFLFVGFSSWLMLPIRANANVVINENNPEDARALLAYYNREQYPGVESPVYGAYYSDLFAAPGENRDDTPKYERDSLPKRFIPNSLLRPAISLLINNGSPDSMILLVNPSPYFNWV